MTFGAVGVALLTLLSGLPGAREGRSDQPPDSTRTDPTTCTYRTYEWSTAEGRAVNRRTVEKDYSELDAEERNPTDPRCTVCSEDQITLDPADFGIEGVDPIRVCWVFADAVREALRTVSASDEFVIVELDGYRVGRTRGRVEDGLRTELSNHSFGTAIDINASHNGLYNRCDVTELTEEAIAGCRLGVGGAWRPSEEPRHSIVEGGIVYRAFVEGVGWRWGGEISGRTRDLMHFSPTGY